MFTFTMTVMKRKWSSAGATGAGAAPPTTLSQDSEVHRRRIARSRGDPPAPAGDPHPLGALAADAPSELDVLGHDGHALGVDGAEVGVLEEADQISLAGLLEGE